MTNRRDTRCLPEKSVLHAYDYGGPDGCHGKTKVIIKVSASSAQHDNERDVYTWLAESELDAREVPHLHFEGRYVTSDYYCLVLDELGPDLERLRAKCRHKRFTPKMTLAVAIQTVLKHLHVCMLLLSPLIFFVWDSCV
jgi:hypothetical protein